MAVLLYPSGFSADIDIDVPGRIFGRIVSSTLTTIQKPNLLGDYS